MSTASLPLRISFSIPDEGSLDVSIDTERLHFRPVKATEEDYGFYEELFQDPETMEKFGPGCARTREVAEKKINLWSQRWNQNNPFSSFAVFEKKTDQFIGSVTLEPGEAPGELEIWYLFKKSHWGKGYGTEGAKAVIRGYIPITIEKGYTLKNNPLRKVTATVRSDNPASIKILEEKIGMKKVCEEDKYGAPRILFSIDL